MPASANGKIESPSGQNEYCICYEDRCNNSPWLEWAKPITRRPTTPRPTTRRPTTPEQAVVTTVSLHLTDQHDVTRYSSDTPTDSEGVPLPTDSEEIPLPTDSEGVPLPTDSEGVPLPTDSEGVHLIEKSMSTQRMEDQTLPVNYNENSTDKIQYNGVKALNDDLVFATSLTLLVYIF